MISWVGALTVMVVAPDIVKLSCQYSDIWEPYELNSSMYEPVLRPLVTYSPYSSKLKKLM